MSRLTQQHLRRMAAPSGSGHAVVISLPAPRFLLDEHYSPKLATWLMEDGIDAVALVGSRPELSGTPDADMLPAAKAEGRVVVTEDVTTFPAAIAQVADHMGVVYCRSQAFHRTPERLGNLRRALAALAVDPPTGLGTTPLAWWLSFSQ